MTILFRAKTMSADDSIAMTFANLKEKFEEYQNKKTTEEEGIP